MKAWSWWHPLSAEIGEAPYPHPVEECVLSDRADLLRRMRDRFERLCRNGWYGPEWRERAGGARAARANEMVCELIPDEEERKP